MVQVALPGGAAGLLRRRYRVVVPDNVALDIRTDGGDVRFARLPRLGAASTTGSGDIDIAGYCGNSLDARARRAATSRSSWTCAPPRLSLRAGSGSIHAVAARRPLRPRRREHVRAATCVRGVTRAHGRAVLGPGAERVGRRGGGGPLVIARARARPPAAPRRARGRATWSSTLPVTLLAIPAVLLLMLGAALSVVGIGLPLLLAAAASAAGSCGWTAARPTAGSTRRSRRSRPRRAGTGQRVPAVARPALRPRAVADRRPSRAASRRSPSALLVVALRARVRARRCCSSSAIDGLGGRRRRSTTSGRGRSGRGSGSLLLALALPAPRSPSRRSRRSNACCARSPAACSRRARAPGGPVREMLAESLGDRTRRRRLLAAGPRALRRRARARRSSCPSRAPGAPGPPSSATGGASPRSSTTPSLDTSRELVQAAAAASSLAIDNERLKADLQARRGGAARLAAADRRGGRRRAAADRARPARRRAAAARGARARAADAQGAAEGPAGGRRRWSTSCRSGWPARWPSCASSPAASTPRSSPTAGSRRRSARWPSAPRCRSTSTSRCEERLPAPVEAAAYFLVAEALTNVDRYAGATQRARRRPARRRHRRRGGRRRRRRRRRPRGGQRPARARGPRRRRSAGRSSIDSPPGGGTRMRAASPARRSPIRVLARRGARVRRAAGCSSSCSCSRRAAAGPPCARDAPVVVSGGSAPVTSPGERPGPAARCGSRSSPTARRRARSGRSSATASTPPRAGSTCSSTTARPTSTASSAWRR